MASLFADAMAEADAVLVEEFGERVRIEPRLALGPGRGELSGPRPDPEREVREVRAQFTLRGAVDTLEGVRQGTKLNGMTRLAVAEAHLRMSAAVLAGLGYPLQADDRIVLVERAGQPAYAIVKPEPSDLADGRYPLVASRS
ncbi:hypothetical protein [Methylobacterium oryzihabitans]|uniref:Uncharacterized protein n=1 Tax=Methylobacterium oryzihabitans TaxID=2499852 RepID=A0A3S2XF38_9HYPH|nr:hypothetical protein [Methylobacterium oryzihabitans]RVU13160.1 hypothetical protein EOE48_27000 [Methylobacterium oryzihabitans]